LKKYSWIILLLLFLTSSGLTAQTQMEMNQTAREDFVAAEAKLNKVYQKVLKTLEGKEKELFIKAQKNWLLYRDSHCEFESEQYDGGSIQPLIQFNCLATKTRERTDELKAILEDETR
jgi:uncharacterized protein YecT (DUF1311 family)